MEKYMSVEGLGSVRTTRDPKFSVERGLEGALDIKDVATPSKKKSFSEIVSSLLDDGFKLNQKKIDAVAQQCGLNNQNEIMQQSELGVVLSARKIAQSGEGIRMRYEKICDLYERQPTISPKDGTARFLQQFSTTAPLAFLAGEFVKGAKKSSYGDLCFLEPSAGNGMLTIALPIDDTHVNELDELRYKNLKAQGFGARNFNNLTKEDANTLIASDYSGVITNPPFANLDKKDYLYRVGKKGGKDITYCFTKLDHKLAIRALEAMTWKGGRCAIIIGGKLSSKMYDFKKAYFNEHDMLFGEFNSLVSYINRQYNLLDILYINGDLYAKQGTTFPLVMLLIEGRKEWDSNPTTVWRKYDPNLDKPIESYTEYFDRMIGHIEKQLPLYKDDSDLERKRKLLILAKAKIAIAKAKASKNDVVLRGLFGTQMDAYKQLNDIFNAKLEELNNGSSSSSYVFQLGMPAKILERCGFPNDPIEMSARHVVRKSVTKHHPFNLAELKGLVYSLQNPIAVFSYGNKQKAQNVITELENETGKKFLIGVHFKQNQRSIVVSNIRGIFPKDNIEWLNWIQQEGKLIYVKKKKVLNLIKDIQGINLSEPAFLDLNLIAKIVKEFKNPK